jgi:hypothetical protein
VADICEHAIESLGSVKGVTSQQLERILGSQGAYATYTRIRLISYNNTLSIVNSVLQGRDFQVWSRLFPHIACRHVRNEHVPTATNLHTAIEELLETVFSTRSVPNVISGTAWRLQ